MTRASLPTTWRHLFKTRVRRAEVEAGIRDAICGHAPVPTAELRGRNRRGHGRGNFEIPVVHP
jgi:hypothetical protein